MYMAVRNYTRKGLQVITDPLTGRTKGFGFVRFADEKERDEAIQEMAGTVINDRPIRVSTATARRAPNPQLVTSHADSKHRRHLTSSSQPSNPLMLAANGQALLSDL